LRPKAKDLDPHHPKFVLLRRALPLHQNFAKLIDTYPGRRRLQICGKDRIVDQSLALSSNGFFAKLNNSVIRGTNTVSKTFTNNDVMEVAMRTYILAIATAALFAIPTAAFSESGHHRYYNRYEGLYDRYESGRCRESRAACTRRFRELCD
jgi:hypothetical protein